MRYCLSVFLLMITCIASADDVRCYSNGKLIYHHHGFQTIYSDGMFAFTEDGTDMTVFTAADCIVKIANKK